ncbi:porin family protein [Enterovibrio norvegicus]|uniref:outer membrane beta-barrel protein n=1 Tax=Enterovibrio norvegicus TaxID=188144 RepID=UPI003D10E271
MKRIIIALIVSSITIPTLASVSNGDVYIFGGGKSEDVMSGFSLGSGYTINEYTSVETSYAYGDNKSTADSVLGHTKVSRTGHFDTVFGIDANPYLRPYFKLGAAYNKSKRTANEPNNKVTVIRDSEFRPHIATGFQFSAPSLSENVFANFEYNQYLGGYSQFNSWGTVSLGYTF